MGIPCVYHPANFSGNLDARPGNYLRDSLKSHPSSFDISREYLRRGRSAALGEGGRISWRISRRCAFRGSAHFLGKPPAIPHAPRQWRFPDECLFARRSNAGGGGGGWAVLGDAFPGPTPERAGIANCTPIRRAAGA